MRYSLAQEKLDLCYHWKSTITIRKNLKITTITLYNRIEIKSGQQTYFGSGTTI
jgi:hypothetical protein